MSPTLTKGDELNTAKETIPAWGWVLASILVIGLFASQVRSCAKQAAKESMQQWIQREYGDAIQDYRSDPVRFRARFHELARREGLTPQQAEEGIEMVRRMSQNVP